LLIKKNGVSKAGVLLTKEKNSMTIIKKRRKKTKPRRSRQKVRKSDYLPEVDNTGGLFL